MDKALVIGLGFISTNLAKYLVDRGGFEVYITYRSVHGSKALMMKDLLECNVKPRRLEPSNYDEVQKAINEVRPSYVFNTVGLLSGSWRDLWDAHVEVPRNLARAIISIDKSIKFIHISASAASGKLGSFISEEPRHCDYAYVKPKSDYERSKCDGERAIRELGAEGGLNYVIVRPTLVYGYYNDHNEFLSLYRFVKRGGLIPYIRGAVSAIYVGYLMRALERLAISNEVRNTFLYIAECQLYGLGNIAELMAEYIGVNGIRIPVHRGGLSVPSYLAVVTT